MTIRIRVRNKLQIITPIRFARVGTGGAVTDTAPDVDDRGFAMATRPSGWGTTDARGAMIGITAGQTVEMKILREDLDPEAPLFVTATPEDLLKVVAPAPGRPLRAAGGLPSFDEFQIRGLKDEAFRCGKVQVRLGRGRSCTGGTGVSHLHGKTAPCARPLRDDPGCSPYPRVRPGVPPGTP
jgi:hypothetical protein